MFRQMLYYLPNNSAVLFRVDKFIYVIQCDKLYCPKHLKFTEFGSEICIIFVSVKSIVFS